MNKEYICCICGGISSSWGNNPDGAMWKIADGKIVEPKFAATDRCCDDCNASYVIPGRLLKMQKIMQERERKWGD